jgi:hypothetical protein
MTLEITNDNSVRKTNIILKVVNNEQQMYSVLRLLVANNMVRDNNKSFMQSLHEGLSKYGTLTENQRNALSRTLRSYGDELLILANERQRASRNISETAE